MDCKYSEKEEVSSNGRHYLVCNITKQRCSAVRYCAKVGDIINTDNYDKNCVVYKEKVSNIGKTDQLTNKVILERRGKLWVETDDVETVVIVENPYDYVPSFVKLIKKQNGEYFIKVKK